MESGEDELADPAATRRGSPRTTCSTPGARLKPADQRRVIELREALRALLLANNGEPLDAGRGRGAERGRRAQRRCEARFDPTGTIGVTGRSAGIDGALGQIIAVVVQAVADGTWTRLKACRGRRVPVGVLRPLAQPLGPVVRDGGVRQPQQGPRLPRAAAQANVSPVQRRRAAPHREAHEPEVAHPLVDGLARVAGDEHRRLAWGRRASPPT